MEKIIFTNPQIIADKVQEIVIFDGKIQYPDFSENEKKLTQVYQQRVQEIFGSELPRLVQERIDKE